MSTTTEKLGLIKPEKTDPADITATNGNWDKLDAHSHPSFDHELSMSGNRITDVGEPQLRSDVATRGFVEDFSIEGSTYVAVDENKDGNIVLRPYVPAEDDYTETLLWEIEDIAAEQSAITVTELGDLSGYSDYIVHVQGSGLHRTKMGENLFIHLVNVWDNGVQLASRTVNLGLDEETGKYQLNIAKCWLKNSDGTYKEHTRMCKVIAVYGIKNRVVNANG